MDDPCQAFIVRADVGRGCGSARVLRCPHRGGSSTAVQSHPCPASGEARRDRRDFWVETGDGQRAFKVNGKALRVRDALVLESPTGDELYSLQEKKLHIRDTMKIERNGKNVATVKKALITTPGPLLDRR